MRDTARISGLHIRLSLTAAGRALGLIAPTRPFVQ
jgi:hypothetical protein